MLGLALGLMLGMTLGIVLGVKALDWNKGIEYQQVKKSNVRDDRKRTEI